jgi:fructose-1,6-bisphosphatase/inositol monophosphatase family enzyme
MKNLKLIEDRMDILRNALGISSHSFLNSIKDKAIAEIKDGISRDVVTKTDLLIDRALSDYFKSLSIPYISEENKISILDCNDSLYVIADPLDGSLNLQCDLDYYATEIALVRNGKIVEGGIISHVKGISMTSNGVDIQFSRSYKVGAQILGVVPPLYLAYGPNIDKANHKFVAKLISASPDNFPGFFRFGSAAHAVLDYISGRYSSGLFLNVRIWDIAGALPAIYSLKDSAAYIRYSDSTISLVCYRNCITYKEIFSDFISGGEYQPLTLDNFDLQVRASLRNG